ncbi:FecR domain-containing protein [Shewanella sp. A14]
MNLNQSAMGATNNSEQATEKLIPPSDIPPHVARKAVEWLMEWQSADKADTVWCSILAWRQAHSHHEQAWQHIETINNKLGILAKPAHANIAHSTLTLPAISRREALKVFSVIAVVGGSSLLTYKQKPWQPWLADYSTTTGEQQQFTLDDGTHIHLNSNTAINVYYTAFERKIALLKGEVYIRTGKLSNAPLIVATTQGELQPLGTRFSAREINNSCRVAVYEGAVQVKPKHQNNSVIVDAGEALNFTTTQCSTPHPINESEAAWTQGIIVASDMPLLAFLTELNRHRPGLIQCDPALAQLNVSGTYPLNRVDDVLHALQQALPIKLQTFTSYWVRVLPDEQFNTSTNG